MSLAEGTVQGDYGYLKSVLPTLIKQGPKLSSLWTRGGSTGWQLDIEGPRGPPRTWEGEAEVALTTKDPQLLRGPQVCRAAYWGGARSAWWPCGSVHGSL